MHLFKICHARLVRPLNHQISQENSAEKNIFPLSRQCVTLDWEAIDTKNGQCFYGVNCGRDVFRGRDSCFTFSTYFSPASCIWHKDPLSLLSEQITGVNKRALIERCIVCIVPFVRSPSPRQTQTDRRAAQRATGINRIELIATRGCTHGRQGVWEKNWNISTLRR